MAGMYLHIPFCSKACHYCNFHFSTTHSLLPAMVAAMQQELLLRKHYLPQGTTLNTIYFGGGTPSILNPAQLLALLATIQQHYNVAADAEITLEANPDNINATQLQAWKNAGVNRLSIGIQSFAEVDLQWMNRAHNATQALDSIRLAQEAGFHNLTIDLIYGTPTLTDEQWLHNIHTAIALNVPHISAYALTVEPRTALDKMIEKGKVPAVDTAQQTNHFNLLMQALGEVGFEHYEISNWAKPSMRSKHNSSYWQGTPYWGIGPSAHSFNGTSRQWNIANNALYIQALRQMEVPFEQEILTPTQQLNEYIMTALRTMEGIQLQKIATWGTKALEMLTLSAKKPIYSDKLIVSSDAIQLTAAGKHFADGIAADLFFEDNNQLM